MTERASESMNEGQNPKTEVPSNNENSSPSRDDAVAPQEMTTTEAEASTTSQTEESADSANTPALPTTEDASPQAKSTDTMEQTTEITTTEAEDQSNTEIAATAAESDSPEAISEAISGESPEDSTESEPQEPEKSPEELRDERELHHFSAVMEFERVRTIVHEYCSSSLGHSVVDRMTFLYDAEAIETCLKQTEEMTGLIADQGRLPLAGIHDASGMIRNALDLSRPLGGKELLKIQSTLEAGKEWTEVIAETNEQFPKLESLIQHIDPLDNLSERIRKILQGNGKVRNDASPRLFELRKKIHSLRSKIESQIVAFTRRPEISRHLQNPHPTQRNGRHVLAVKTEQRRHVPGILHDRSKTGSTVFIEPDSIVAMGNELQDLSYDESAEITRILWAITQAVVKSFTEIEIVTRTLGWLDFTHAKSKLAKAYKLTLPETSEKSLELRDLGHLLLMEQSVTRRAKGEEADEIIRSTVRLGDDFNMLILTGPNTGGKTVLLKSIGLAALMHQAGMPIPAAEGSKLPVFERLYADIGDEQSIQQNLSTFSAHISRMKDFLEGANDKTLILVDELGAGTDPQEGAALGRAMLSHFLESGALSLVTTHLGSLKDFAFQHPGAENGAMAFNSETLSPTYRLYIGQPGSSNALAIAERLKVPGNLLAKAREILAGEDTSSNDLINAIQKVRLENERIRETLLQQEQQSKTALAEAEENRVQSEKLKEAVSVEADLEMTERFQKLERALEATYSDLKGERGQIQNRLNQLKKEVNEILYHTPYGEKRRRFAESLRKGDEVYLISFGQVAKIEKINKERKKLTVRMNSLPIQTRFDDVSWVEGAQNRAGARFEMAQTREAELAMRRLRQLERELTEQEQAVEKAKKEAERHASRPRREGGGNRRGGRNNSQRTRRGSNQSQRTPRIDGKPAGKPGQKRDHEKGSGQSRRNNRRRRPGGNKPKSPNSDSAQN